MNQLRDWFDGGDVVALFFGLASIAVSIWLFFRQNSINDKNLNLQTRLTNIEEARHTEEVAHANRADVFVSLRRTPRASGKGTNEHLIFENRGGADAQNFDLEEVVSLPRGGPPVSYVKDVFPVSRLQPNRPINCNVMLHMGHGPSLEVTMTWTDPRGTQRQSQVVTLGA